MAVFLADFVAILVVGYLFLRRGRDQKVRQSRTARWLLVAALIPLGLQVAIFLLFGIGEIASGDLSGVGHLLPVVSAALLGLLSWQRPQEGGVALFLVGVVTTAGLSDTTATLIMAAPQIVSGLLFLIGGMIARNERMPEADQGS